MSTPRYGKVTAKAKRAGRNGSGAHVVSPETDACRAILDRIRQRAERREEIRAQDGSVRYIVKDGIPQ